MSNEDIDAAVQQAKKDMFSARIKFAKREVRWERGGGRRPTIAALHGSLACAPCLPA